MVVDLKELLISEVDGNPKSPFPPASESEVEEFEKLIDARVLH